MKAYRIITLLLTTLHFHAVGQLQNNQWRFGFNSAIDFNTDPPTFPTGSAQPSILPPLITGTMIEGTASIADPATGALLFYTDGVTIWNELDQPMPNGSELGGSDLLSSYMAAVIVPLPGSCTRYYVFCIDDYEEGSDGITYSVVDMTLDNGLGDVVPGQKSIPLYDNETEILMVCPNSAGDGYWLVSNGADINNPTLAAFAITAAGVNPEPVLSPVYLNGGGKLNYAGTKFACQGMVDSLTGYFVGFHLYDFDAATGQLSNLMHVPFENNDILAYFEFTFDGDYLYAGGNYSLYHFDLTSGDAETIASTGTLIPIGDGIDAHAAAQLGPNGNLYYVVGSTVYSIENPDNPANLIGPITALPSTVAPFYCLPQWIHLLNDPEGQISQTGDLCQQTQQLFTISNSSAIQEILWDFDDPASGEANTSALISPSHAFSSAGSYQVSAIVNYECSSDTVFFALDIVECDNSCDASVEVSGDSCVQTPIPFALESNAEIVSVLWDFDDASSGSANTSTSANPTHLFSEAGVFDVSVIATLACGVDTVTTTLNMIDCASLFEACEVVIPNVFTPNSDSSNERFYPSTECTFEEYSMRVFNRWGEEVFSTAQQNSAWLGRNENIDCADGVYYYIVSYKFPTQPVQYREGFVTLLR
jgi:gliding motility-associated-like protein